MEKLFNSLITMNLLLLGIATYPVDAALSVTTSKTIQGKKPEIANLADFKKKLGFTFQSKTYYPENAGYNETASNIGVTFPPRTDPTATKFSDFTVSVDTLSQSDFIDPDGDNNFTFSTSSAKLTWYYSGRNRSPWSGSALLPRMQI